jgi:hypothetical protein
VCGFATLSVCLIAFNDGARRALKSGLNMTAFNLVYPANDWTFSGRVAVYPNRNPKAGTPFSQGSSDLWVRYARVVTSRLDLILTIFRAFQQTLKPLEDCLCGLPFYYS